MSDPTRWCKKCGDHMAWCDCGHKPFFYHHPFYSLDENDWRKGYALDPEAMAQSVGERLFGDEPADPAHFEETIRIKDHGEFVVTAEAAVHFRIRRKNNR